MYVIRDNRFYSTSDTTTPMVWWSGVSTSTATSPTWTTAYSTATTTSTNTIIWAVNQVITTTPIYIRDNVIWSSADWAPPPPSAPAIRRSRDTWPRRTIREHARETVRQLEDARKNETVKQRARRLLLRHLTAEQRETLLERGWFIVEGGKSKQRYRIRDKNYAGNIEMLDGEQATHRLCCHADPSLPVADHLLAQKIMLEVAEDEFKRLANITRIAA